MAIFAKDKEKKEAKDKAVKTIKVSKATPAVKAVATKSVATKTPATATVAIPTEGKTSKALLVITPHVTEKAHLHAEKLNSYTFKVTGNSNKKSIAHEIFVQYKVTPMKIRIVNTSDRRVSYRGRVNYKSGFKKAYVTLKKGDKIDIA